MNAAIFMAQAYNENMFFSLGEDGTLQMDAPDDVYENSELMAMVKEHKAGVIKLIVGGIDRAKDGLTCLEMRSLTKAVMGGHNG